MSVVVGQWDKARGGKAVAAQGAMTKGIRRTRAEARWAGSRVAGAASKGHSGERCGRTGAGREQWQCVVAVLMRRIRRDGAGLDFGLAVVERGREAMEAVVQTCCSKSQSWCSRARTRPEAHIGRRQITILLATCTRNPDPSPFASFSH
jgi:hypothetical protein